MNKESYQVHFESLSDAKLDKAIEELVEMPQFQNIAMAAVQEWERRYPGTIAPFLHKRVMERGGFPKCYSGPTETVKIDEE